MRTLRYVLSVVLVTGMILPKQSFAASDEELLKRLESLEQQVAILKRQLEVRDEEAAKKAPDVPVITASAKDGFSIKAPDDSFKIKIRGLIQADGRIFADDKKDLGYNDNFLVRRARPIIEGTVSRDFDFYLMPDFGSGTPQLVDAYLEYKYFPQAKFKGGKFKVPFGLERLQSDAVANFTELGLPGNLTPNRDVGFQLSGDVLNEKVNYAVGIFDGAADNGNLDADVNNDKEVAARIFAQPWKNTDSILSGFGAGAAVTYGHKEGSTVPTYRSAGQASIFTYGTGVVADGPHLRFSPQFYFYRNSLGLLGEYISSDQTVSRVSGGNVFKEGFNNTGWQVSGSYVLTGENASYKGVVPRKPFSPTDHTWGAFEVVARYESLNIDEDIFNTGFANLNTAVSGARAWGGGLNWYLNRNLRLMLDFEHTVFDRGNVSNEDRKDENAILTRVQLSY